MLQVGKREMGRKQKGWRGEERRREKEEEEEERST
jgi:hypothetical protein